MKIINEEVIIEGSYRLAATLTKPQNDQKKPAALIIGGTGTLNRDGNGRGFKMNIYKFLAEALARMGYVTLRYDKRGVGLSEGKAINAGLYDIVDDALSCVRFLKAQEEVDGDKLILVGHSEGCIVSTLLAEKESLAGFLLLSGAGVGLRTSMEEQARKILEDVEKTKGIKKLILQRALTEKSVIGKQVKLFEKVSGSSTDTIRIQMMKFPAKWLREHLKVTDTDILGKLKRMDQPILAITGNKDVQTGHEHLKDLDDLGADNIETCVIENMDHMLKFYDGELNLLDIKKQYAKEKTLPLHEALIGPIEQWSRAYIFRQ